MAILLIAGIIPAVILIKIGQTRRPAAEDPLSYARWAKFLAISLITMLGITLVGWVLFRDFASIFIILLLPSMCGLIAESCHFWIGAFTGIITARPAPHPQRSALFFLPVIVLLVGLGWLGDSFVLQALLIGGAMLAIGQWVWGKMGWGLALSYLLLIALLLFSVWGTDTQSEFPFLPSSMVPFARNALWIGPGLGIIFLCQAWAWVLTGDNPERGGRARRWLAAGLLSAPVIVLILWQTVTASAWDVATDGLGGVFMMELAGVLGVAAVIHPSWSLSSRRQTLLFSFSVLLPFIVTIATSFGTFGFDGAWGNVPRARTARRAELINQAILRYHDRQRSYPASLGDLTPDYLLYLPVPFIIPHQDWCYQGGVDFYRLGYVARDYFSTPASVKVHAFAGQPPEQLWSCDAEAAKYPAPAGYTGP